LDGNFQQTYQAAERAYGGGDYETAHHLASELLKQLELADPADDDQVRDAVLGWRAFVTLLLGHIELHGLRRPDLAAGYYQLTLDCKPQDTLADLAKQGLQRSLVEPSAESLPSMLQDPFLNTAAPASTSGTSQSTATPWLVESFDHSKPKEARLDQHQSSQAPIKVEEAISGITPQLNDGGEFAQLASPAQTQPLSPPLASPWWRQQHQQ
jgi:hypothetical protein